MANTSASVASSGGISERRHRRSLIALMSMAIASCGGSDSAPASSSAVPVANGVTGTLSHGQSVTITGQSFGTKAHAGPMLYDDFDNAPGDIVTTSGTGRAPMIHQGNLSSYGEWEKDISPSSESGLHAISRSSSSPKVRSTYHARMAFDGDSSPWGIALLVPYPNFTTGNELYISYYHRYTKTSANWGRQMKAWFAFNSGFAQDKAYWANSFGTCQAGNNWRTHRTESTNEHSLSPDLSATGIDSEWVRFESYLKQSGAGQSNGAWHQVTYRSSLATPQRNEAILHNYKMRDSAQEWVLWTFGGAYYDICNSGDTLMVDLDEFYMDSTPARVEVCNASTWAARTHCELQLPLTWSDTGITFTFKRGHLGVGPAHLYIVNPSGSVNPEGFPVSIQ